MEFFSQTKAEVIKFFKTDENHGLDENRVDDLYEEYGLNKLKEKKKKTNLQRFFEQFMDAMILILIVAAVISFVIACVEGEMKDFYGRYAGK